MGVGRTSPRDAGSGRLRRAAKLSAERRSKIARRAALARWAKRRNQEPFPLAVHYSPFPGVGSFLLLAPQATPSKFASPPNRLVTTRTCFPAIGCARSFMA